MNDWELLKKLTQARIGIGRSGHSVLTKAHLQFQLDHARARDAIFWPWKIEALQKNLKKRGIPQISLQSAVSDRAEYLKRPDLGRILAESSRMALKKKIAVKKSQFDVAITVSNGLSSSAVNQHGWKFLSPLWDELREAGLSVAPVCLVESARVALSDEVGELTRARLSLIVLGERPGLSSFDSLAVYLTYAPRSGSSDARRNCISNIRPPDGLSYEASVKKTMFLARESFRRRLSGVDLKEELNLLT
jgi:ethanolamine ammonia-lyase small subunit